MQKVNTTNDKIRKKYDKVKFLSSMHSSMSSLYDGDSKKNTTLTELNVRQHKRFKDNIIHLWNVRNCAEYKHIYYDNIQFGKGVFAKPNEKIYGGNKRNRYINLHKTKEILLYLLQIKVTV